MESKTKARKKEKEEKETARNYTDAEERNKTEKRQRIEKKMTKRKDRNVMEKTKKTKEGGDEANKGEITEEELQTTNSVKSGIESDMFDLIGMLDSDMLNHLRAKRRKGQRRTR